MFVYCLVLLVLCQGTLQQEDICEVVLETCQRDVCSENNGGCSQYCTTDESGDNVTCSCADGYKLLSNGVTCVAILEVSLVNSYLNLCLPGSEIEVCGGDNRIDEGPDEVDIILRRDITCNGPVPEGVDPVSAASKRDVASAQPSYSCADSDHNLIYFYDPTCGDCTPLCVDSTDPPTTSNQYPRLEECQWFCEDPCSQRVDPGTCDPDDQEPAESITRYYYNSGSGQCETFSFTNCAGNKNNFESKEECEGVCKPELVDSSFPEIALPPEGADDFPVGTCPDLTDEEYTRWKDLCSRVDDEAPRLLGILFNLESAETTDEFEENLDYLNAELEDELLDNEALEANQTAAATAATGRRLITGPIGGQFNHLFWAKTEKQFSCKTFIVTVYISCKQALFNSPSKSEFDRLCELFKEGVEQYWSRDVIYQGETWKVDVRVWERSWQAKQVVIKYYSQSGGNTRSFKAEPYPIVARYRAYASNADEEFKFNAAQLLGHSVLYRTAGVQWSWTHKGTTTYYGRLTSGATTVPTSGEIDIMKRYTNGPQVGDYDRVIATEGDALGLANIAIPFFTVPWCAGEASAYCAKNSHCRLEHHVCIYGSCGRCTVHIHCNPGEYCTVDQPPGSTECKPRKVNGETCYCGAMCKSGYCAGNPGICQECTDHLDCGDFSLYCDPMQNICYSKKRIGATCVEDFECYSDACAFGLCSLCVRDDQCPGDKYCSSRDNFQCVPKKGQGAGCWRDAVCVSDHCDGAKCGECDNDRDCPAGQFCKNKSVPFVANICRAAYCCRHVCTRDRMCASGKCRTIRLCKKASCC